MHQYIRIVNGIRLIDYDQLSLAARISFLNEVCQIGAEYAQAYPDASSADAEAYADFALDLVEGDCEAQFEAETRAWARELIVQNILTKTSS